MEVGIDTAVAAAVAAADSRHRHLGAFPTVQGLSEESNQTNVAALARVWPDNK